MSRERIREEDEAPPPRCYLCERPLGTRTEWHHPVPKSRGGRVKVPVHPICHQKIHAVFSHGELARAAGDAASLRDHPDVATFLRWIEGKDPDFHAPTHKRR